MKTDKATLPGFVERLQAGPAFLLLGQRYLSLETGSDPLLGEITRRYGPELVDKADYFTLFGGTAPVPVTQRWHGLMSAVEDCTLPNGSKPFPTSRGVECIRLLLILCSHPLSAKHGGASSRSLMRNMYRVIQEIEACFTLPIFSGRLTTTMRQHDRL
jgi:hypothetical protein